MGSAARGRAPTDYDAPGGPIGRMPERPRERRFPASGAEQPRDVQLLDSSYSARRSRVGRSVPGRPEGASAADDLVKQAAGRAREGDRGALQYLYARFAGEVQRYVERIVHEPHDAEDITQNVFAKLTSSLERYEQRESPFVAWLLRVARNAALDEVRQQRAIPCADVHPARASTDERQSRSAEALRDALETVPEEQRVVLLLRHVAGLSPTEIAERIGKTEGAVHGLHHRGRAAVRAALERLDSAPATVGTDRG